jgi:hypothetical protein
MHITQKVHLSEFLRDKRYDAEQGRGLPKSPSHNTPRPTTQSAWLDDETSDDEQFEFRAH